MSNFNVTTTASHLTGGKEIASFIPPGRKSIQCLRFDDLIKGTAYSVHVLEGTVDLKGRVETLETLSERVHMNEQKLEQMQRNPNRLAGILIGTIITAAIVAGIACGMIYGIAPLAAILGALWLISGVVAVFNYPTPSDVGNASMVFWGPLLILVVKMLEPLELKQEIKRDKLEEQELTSQVHGLQIYLRKEGDKIAEYLRGLESKLLENLDELRNRPGELTTQEATNLAKTTESLEKVRETLAKLQSSLKIARLAKNPSLEKLKGTEGQLVKEGRWHKTLSSEET